VHLLLEMPPTQALSGVVNSLKTVSSRLLRKWHRAEMERHFRKPVLWSRSYFVSSVGGANRGSSTAAVSGRR
jgi:putative transposase